MGITQSKHVSNIKFPIITHYMSDSGYAQVWAFAPRGKQF